MPASMTSRYPSSAGGLGVLSETSESGYRHFPGLISDEPIGGSRPPAMSLPTLAQARRTVRLAMEHELLTRVTRSGDVWGRPGFRPRSP